MTHSVENGSTVYISAVCTQSSGFELEGQGSTTMGRPVSEKNLDTVVEYHNLPLVLVLQPPLGLPVAGLRVKQFAMIAIHLVADNHPVDRLSNQPGPTGRQ